MYRHTLNIEDCENIVECLGRYTPSTQQWETDLTLEDTYWGGVTTLPGDSAEAEYPQDVHTGHPMEEWCKGATDAPKAYARLHYHEAQQTLLRSDLIRETSLRREQLRNSVEANEKVCRELCCFPAPLFDFYPIQVASLNSLVEHQEKLIATLFGRVWPGPGETFRGVEGAVGVQAPPSSCQSLVSAEGDACGGDAQSRSVGVDAFPSHRTVRKQKTPKTEPLDVKRVKSAKSTKSERTEREDSTAKKTPKDPEKRLRRSKGPSKRLLEIV